MHNIILYYIKNLWIEKMASKTYRIKSDLVEKAKKKQLEYIINKKITVDEAEVINAILLKGIENLKDSDIDKYLELIEDKKIN